MINTKTKSLKFCTLKFYEHIVINTINEGANIDYDAAAIMTQECLSVYHKKPFVYITKRANSYSVDPNIYIDLVNIKSLIGFAVVCDNDSLAHKNAEIEQLFFNNKKPFKIFEKLDDATEWAVKIINNI